MNSLSSLDSSRKPGVNNLKHTEFIERTCLGRKDLNKLNIFTKLSGWKRNESILWYPRYQVSYAF